MEISQDITTQLLNAAKNGEINTVKNLLAKGADINAQNTIGETALHRAIQFWKNDVAHYLIQNNADVNLKDIGGNTPLMGAFPSGNYDMAKFLIENAPNINLNAKNNWGLGALYFTVGSKKKDLVELLLNKNVSVDTQDSWGNTVLKTAAEIYPKARDRNDKRQILDIIKLLIKKDADINIKNSKGKSALDIALEAKELPLIQALTGS